jgi:hypothetical protein
MPGLKIRSLAARRPLLGGATSPSGIDLLGQVLLVPDLGDLVLLRLNPVDVALLVDDDPLQEVPCDVGTPSRNRIR